MASEDQDERALSSRLGPEAVTAVAQAPAVARRPRGRPPRLTLDSILTAAVAIGGDQLTMAQLAAKLDVTVSALYRHVGSRDELILLMSDHQNRTRPRSDLRDRHWSLILIDVTEQTFSFFCESTSGLERFRAGEFGPQTRMPLQRETAQALEQQGFARLEAITLCRTASAIGAGAAMCRLHVRSINSTGRSYAALVLEAADQAGAEADPTALMHEDDWRRPMRVLLASVAACRGEALPPDADQRLPILRQG